MSQIWLPAGADDTRSVEEQFLDLLLADDDLIQAEFDAIIAAEWPGPPRTCPADASAAAQTPAGDVVTEPRRPRGLVPDGDHPWTGRRGNAHRRQTTKEKTDQEKGR